MANEPQLRQQLVHHEYLREQLAEKFPDADEETLRDTLEGMTDLTEMLVEVIRSSLDDAALVEALKQRMENMVERRGRFERRCQNKRELVLEFMERADIRKINESDFTASLRASRPKVVITDESAIPSSFWIPQEPKLDRNALNRALGTGEPIPGANLSNTSSIISVRTK